MSGCLCTEYNLWASRETDDLINCTLASIELRIQKALSGGKALRTVVQFFDKPGDKKEIRDDAV